MLLLTEDDVRQLLTMDMALEAVEEGLRRLALDEAVNIPRARAQTDHVVLHTLSAAAKTLGVAGFKAYSTLADSIVDHGHWFIDNSRYAPALAVKDNPRAFARAIADAGYATDPGYAPKLITLMDRFDLYAYDMAPPEASAGD